MNASAGRAISDYQIQFLYRPGKNLSLGQFETLAGELRECAATCFEEVPAYQCLVETREALSDKVLAVAWRRDGHIGGFCSAVLLPVEGVGEVFHLGLTCVRPEDRSAGLTHILTSKVAVEYLLRRRPFSKVWLTNAACVLSSLGNVALHFDEVYPGPEFAERPGEKHLRIARAISEDHREKMFVHTDACFDEDAFVFRRANAGNCFQKKAQDTRFHHRRADLNDYYSGLMGWSDGDVVLQVGSFSLLTGARYFGSRLLSSLRSRGAKVRVSAGSRKGTQAA